MGPQVQLWVPCLVLAHVFAVFWMVRAFLLARTQRFRKRGLSLLGKNPEPGSTAGAPPAPSSESSCGVSSVDVEACCTVPASKLAPAARDDSAAGNDQTLNHSEAVDISSIKLPIPGLDDCQLPIGTTCVQSKSPAEPVTLEWQALGCSYNFHGEPKVVLQDVWGRAEPGQMQAIMGPSGAGKSTLMDMLAMRKSVGDLTGRLVANGEEATASFIRHTSYVPQENTFIPTMTCRETLVFYAGVTLGDKWSRSERKERVGEVLAAVGLADSTETLVGGVLPGGLSLRGLSGGELRRLSIAAGILAHPSVLFLDEPTSGLDSFAALSVMGYLQHLAQTTQQTVIATIHQPRSAIWEMFDTVSLLASGRLMFHGRCVDMVPWFQSLGYTYLKGSESDWVLDLVATGFDKPSSLFGDTLRTTADVYAAADAFQQHYIKTADCQLLPTSLGGKSTSSRAASVASNGSSGSPRKLSARLVNGVSGAGSVWNSLASPSYPTGWGRQFVALFKRELAGMTRNPFDVAARVLTFTYVALLFGLMAYRVPFQGVEGFRSRSNIIFVTCMNIMLFPYVSISLYTADKRIYLADASAKRYRPSAYYVSKVLATVPFSLVCTLAYCGVLYGLSGLREGAVHFAKYYCIVSLFYLIACQVLHMSAVIAPNQDGTFVLSIIWVCVQTLCSSFFINFAQAFNQWLTQLRYISALYFSMEALFQNELEGGVVDCSKGLQNDQVDLLTSAVGNMTAMQKTVLNQLKRPQPGCIFHEDALLRPMGFKRPFGVLVGILVGYLGVLHVLTFLALVVVARRERR